MAYGLDGFNWHICEKCFSFLIKCTHKNTASVNVHLITFRSHVTNMEQASNWPIHSTMKIFQKQYWIYKYLGCFCLSLCVCVYTYIHTYTGWCTKCHTIDCARNTFLLLQKHLTSGTELILIGWKIFLMKNMFNVTTVLPHNLLQTNPCIRHNFSTQVFRKHAAQLHYVGPELCYIFWPPKERSSGPTQWCCAARFLKTCVEKVWQMQGFICKRMWGKSVVTLNMFFIRNNFPAYED